MKLLPQKKETGATLAMTLVLLLLVSVLGISAVQTSLVEEKMSGNLRDKHIAFEAAESALSVGESWLEVLERLPKVVPSSPGNSAIWGYGDPGTGRWWDTDSSWWNSNGRSVAGNSSQASNPVYMVEYRFFDQSGEDLSIGTGGPPQGKYFLQVYARGYGGSAETRVHLKTTYIKRFDGG